MPATQGLPKRMLDLMAIRSFLVTRLIGDTPRSFGGGQTPLFRQFPTANCISVVFSTTLEARRTSKRTIPPS